VYFVCLSGEYRERGDYYDDYQYSDYSYDYNSYVSKDDLLRYDNYDYRGRGPVYNYSVHHPGIITYLTLNASA